MASLESLFIGEKIYQKIENCETWEDVLLTIRKGLKPFEKNFIRELTEKDVEKLTEIKIKGYLNSIETMQKKPWRSSIVLLKRLNTISIIL